MRFMHVSHATVGLRAFSRALRRLVLPILFIALRADAQPDTLSFDGMKSVWEGQLLAVTTFAHELDVQFNARFTPAEKCTLKGIVLGFSVVKFDPVSTNDTLMVIVYESGTVPPLLVGVERTYKFSLGDQGIPLGNIQFTDPLSSGTREAGTFVFPKPIVFAPKRDFIIGVKVLSTQHYAVGAGNWNGFALVTKRGCAEYQRFNRYSIQSPVSHSNNLPTAGANNASIFFRAIVENDATLADHPLTDAGAEEEATALSFLSNHPNPFTTATTLEFALAASQHATLTVHDLLGREVARLLDGTLAAGRHSSRFDPRSLGLPPGIYLARLSAGARTTTRAVLCTQ